MSLLSLADQYRLFTAYRHVFSGSKSKYRKMKKIQIEVGKSVNEVSFRGLVRDYGTEMIVSTVSTLLERGIFGSDLKAQIMFSEFYGTSETADIIQVESGEPTASNEVITLEHTKTISENSGEQHICTKQESGSIYKPAQRRLRSQTKSTPFRSTELPFRTQYIILPSAQRILEECCFEFAMKWAPQILARNQWDCAEAVELNKITAVLVSICEQLPNGALLPSLSMSLKEILRATDELRHSAVHRIRRTAEAVERMLEVACQLAQALQDQERLRTLQNLQQAIKQAILQRTLERSNLRQRFNQELEDIMLLRQQLDRREEAALALMMKQDEEDSRSTALKLETTAKTIFASAAEPELADGNLPKQSRSRTLSENVDLESVLILKMNSKVDIRGIPSNSKTVEDVTGDDGINEDKWDGVFAAVGLTQPHNDIAPSHPAARNTHACVPIAADVSTAYTGTDGQPCIIDQKHKTVEKPSRLNDVPFSADTNAQDGHTACTANNQNTTFTSRPAENMRMEIREISTVDKEANSSRGRRAASDGEEVMERLAGCKRRRLWA